MKPRISSIPPTTTRSPAFDGLDRRSTVADVCLARQPIFDTTGVVTGYELLYRRTVTDTAAGGVDHSVMAADVIVHACLNIGLEQLTSGRLA